MTDTDVNEVEKSEEVEVIDVKGTQDGVTRWLIFLSSLAEIVAWLLLILMVGIGLFTAWNVIVNRGPMNQMLLSLATGSLYTILIGLFYFIVLMAVSKGINVLLDIRDSTDALVEEE